MNILHTVEFYSPSVGGAQEVMKQISERLVSRGHSVTVATTRLHNRKTPEINGVKIEEFDAQGNATIGLKGEIQRYQDFLRAGKFDIMLNYAAQQWTTDAAIPILDSIPYPKILIPCGFSGLYHPAYHDYYQTMKSVLHRYDHLVFHASNYRDIDFARKIGISQLSIIPNGASKDEFEHYTLDFRKKYNIPKDKPILLTVGSHTGVKGHQLVMDAFRNMKHKSGVLVIIGNQISSEGSKELFVTPIINSLKHAKFITTLKIINRAIFGGIGPGCMPDCNKEAREINWSSVGNKQVLLIDPPRSEVVSAYQAADLFVFGSNIEYSPLVLFEAMASHTPFISLSCGNASEIVDWSSGGVIAQTIISENGMANGDVKSFSEMIDYYLDHPESRKEMADSGYRSWNSRFSWEKISGEYEKLYMAVIKK